MAAPNLVNVTSITGKIDGHALTTDAIDNANSSVNLDLSMIHLSGIMQRL